MRLLIQSVTATFIVGGQLACHVAAAPSPSSGVPGAVERTLQLRDQQLAMLEWPGSGAPIVLLHGLGGNAATWAGFAREFAGRHLIAIDLPGHGNSPPPTEWSYLPMARQIVSAVQSQWPGPRVWVGHSWGGKLAVAVAAADSAYVRGLVLVDAVQASSISARDPLATLNRLLAGELDPWPSMDSAQRAVQALRQYSPWTADVEVAFRRAVRVAPDGRVIPRLTRENGVEVMRSFAEDLSTAAMSIRAPVLIISAGTSAGGAHRPLFPTAEFVSVPGNHWLQISNTKGTAAAVRQWLERVGH